MIKYKDFIEYLKYIGIQTKKQRESIYSYYKYCYCNKFRCSKLSKHIEYFGYESGASEEITRFISFPKYRERMIKEVKKYSNFGVWGKELRHEVIL